MRYVPYKRLGNQENIIVDGKALPSTVLTLSHWRDSETPEELKADLSCEIVLNYLESAEHRVDVEIASNNHFDEDGLTGLFALLNPEYALEEKELLIDVATAGDFGTYKDRDAARVCFVLQAWTDPETSPLKRAVFNRPYDEVTSILYEELLPRLRNILERVHYLEKYWLKEDEHLTFSESAIESGCIRIIERKEADLAIVEVSDDKEFNRSRPAFASSRFSHTACHQFAVHNKTSASRILVRQGRRFDFYYRYETWVETVKRRPPERIDLRAIADRLSLLEKKGLHWTNERIDEIVPHLHPLEGKESSIEPELVERELVRFFSEANNAKNHPS